MESIGDKIGYPLVYKNGDPDWNIGNIVLFVRIFKLLFLLNDRIVALCNCGYKISSYKR